MKKHIKVGSVLFILTIIVGVGTVSAGSDQPASETEQAYSISSLHSIPPWQEILVDTNTDVGRHVSVDINYGKTFVSYYDAENKDLRLAMHVGSGGNCGPNNSWHCQIVDSMGDVGQYNSIATKPAENETRVFISYYNATVGSLKYATGICNSTCSFTSATIDSGNPNFFIYKGKYTSVKYDWYGIPHISYYYQNSLGNDALLYAHWVGHGLGNCGTGSDANDWQCDVIHNAEGVGQYTSIDLDDDDHPSIAYYDAVNGYPLVAAYVGSGGSCGPGNSWYCRPVSHATKDIGKYVSLAVEDSGLPHLAYYNTTDQTLEYAKFVGTGGNCGFSSVSLQFEWQCDEIEDMGTSLTSMGLSMALDNQGYPMIAYQDTSEDLAPAALKFATPGSAYGLVPGETNCGPGMLFYTWYCGFVDGGGSYTDEGGSVSLAFNPAGLATIAYFELDTYAYPNEGNLKVAYQQMRQFVPLILKH
ncbi:MAG: hypothetical protein ACK2UM_07295 [Anaerolineales bacterium]